MEVRRQAHCVYRCMYHIVWIPRYRYQVLVNGVDEYPGDKVGRDPEVSSRARVRRAKCPTGPCAHRGEFSAEVKYRRGGTVDETEHGQSIAREVQVFAGTVLGKRGYIMDGWVFREYSEAWMRRRSDATFGYQEK